MLPVIEFDDGEVERGEPRGETVERATALFREHGVLLLHRAFPRALIERLHAAFVDRYRAMYRDRRRRHVEKVGDKRHLRVVEIDGAFNDPDLYAGRFLIPIYAALFGEQFILGQFGSVTALPGAGDQGWHRDSPWLFSADVDVALPPYAITTVIPLIDLDEETGATRTWPGSHRQPDDEAAAKMAFADPEMHRGSVLLMDSRLRHGGTANTSDRERPILYLSYQRVWFRDYDGYSKAPPVHVGDAAFRQVPLRYRELFAWARADNTPETLRLALRRLVKRNTPDAVKRALRRFR